MERQADYLIEQLKDFGSKERGKDRLKRGAPDHREPLPFPSSLSLLHSHESIMKEGIYQRADAVLFDPPEGIRGRGGQNFLGHSHLLHWGSSVPTVSPSLSPQTVAAPDNKVVKEKGEKKKKKKKKSEKKERNPCSASSINHLRNESLISH